MKISMLALMLLLASSLLFAQAADEQLLAAQMAYQQGSAQLSQVVEKRIQAESSKTTADQRLADAQAAQQKATTDLATAQAMEAAAKKTMDQLTTDLNAAWKRKQGL